MTTHLCPPHADGTMPCCGRSPFEVPYTDRMTVDHANVTCNRPPMPPPETLGELRHDVSLRYHTDPEFHAIVYMAATIATTDIKERERFQYDGPDFRDVQDATIMAAAMALLIQEHDLHHFNQQEGSR